MEVQTILAPKLARLLNSGTSLALIDVRERNEYEKEQIFGATNIPRSQLESKISLLVPVINTLIILYDDNEVRAQLAAKTLAKNGYTNISYLEGGIAEWKQSGHSVVEGVNVPSKAFGEIISEVRKEISTVSPEELKKWLDDEEGRVVIFEVRPPEEVAKTGSIPGAINIPGVELPLRINDYIQPGRKIVTTCAGRTRGFIASATLKKMEIPNVYDLNNGTKGWRLAGYDLVPQIPQGPAPSTNSRKLADEFARRFAEKEDIRFISADQLEILRGKVKEKTLFLLDVRTLEEYRIIGHIPGSISAPGGQAIQNADNVVPLRHENVVFVCDNGTRSVITAYWYQQMGFDQVYVLEGGLNGWVNHERILGQGNPILKPLGVSEAFTQVKQIGVSEIKGFLHENSELVILHVGNSISFGEGHLPGAHWISRSRLEERIGKIVLDKKRKLLITGSDPYQPVLAAVTLQEEGFEDVSVLEGGTSAWAAVGYDLERGTEGIEPDDIFVPLTDYDLRQSLRYIQWEEQLAILPEYMAYFANRGILKQEEFPEQLRDAFAKEASGFIQ